jgi:hypothetical protein
MYVFEKGRYKAGTKICNFDVFCCVVRAVA